MKKAIHALLGHIWESEPGRFIPTRALGPMAHTNHRKCRLCGERQWKFTLVPMTDRCGWKGYDENVDGENASMSELIAQGRSEVWEEYRQFCR